jgi:hypothetical protein
LAGDLELRYHSAEEFEKDLRAYLADQPVTAARDRISWESNATVDKAVEKAIKIEPIAPPPNGHPTVRVEQNLPKARHNPTRLTTAQLPADVPSPRKRPRRWRFMQPGSTNVAIALIAGVLAGFMVFVPVIYYLRVYNEVAPLRTVRDYAHDGSGLLDSDWALYQELQNRTQFMGALSPLNLAEGRLRNNLTSAADTIIDGYRTSASTRPKDCDWAFARKCLRYALQIDSTDTKVKGKLALTEGYCNLIQNPRPPKANMSIDNFRQAASYLPHLPDAHLGLAYLYLYVYHNIGEADAEFQEAQKLGFHLGPREQAQRADGYLFRSQYELAHARRAASKNKDEAERWLQMCDTDIENARRLYEPLVGFSNVSNNLEQLEQIKLEQASLESQGNK